MEKLPRRIEKKPKPVKSRLANALLGSSLCLTLQFGSYVDLLPNYLDQQPSPPAKSSALLLTLVSNQPEVSIRKTTPPETATATATATALEPNEPDQPVQFEVDAVEEAILEATPSPEPLPSHILNPQNLDEIKSMITYYANKYHINPHWLIELARCESTFRPAVIGLGGTGVFQFADGTFIYATSFIPNEERLEDEPWKINNPRHNTLAAVVYIPRVNIYREWGCAGTADAMSKVRWYS